MTNTECTHSFTNKELDYNTFMDQLSAAAAKLNEPSVTISVFGSPKLIHKLTEYISQSPSEIGLVDLNNTITKVTYGKREFRFVSTDMMHDNTSLIIVPCRSSNAIYYTGV